MHSLVLGRVQTQVAALSHLAQRKDAVVELVQPQVAVGRQPASHAWGHDHGGREQRAQAYQAPPHLLDFRARAAKNERMKHLVEPQMTWIHWCKERKQWRTYSSNNDV